MQLSDFQLMLGIVASTIGDALSGLSDVTVIDEPHVSLLMLLLGMLIVDAMMDFLDDLRGFDD